MKDPKYHTLLAFHKDTKEPIEKCLCSAFDKFIPPEGFWKDITSKRFVIIGCQREGDFKEEHPDLLGFLPGDGLPSDYPKEITAIVENPRDMNLENARKLGRSDYFIDRTAGF